VGKKLSEKFSIPHIPVFIDPWVDISYYRDFKRSKLTLAIDRHFERSVLENASRLVFVTNSMKEDYVARYPQLKEKSNVLYWGYDEKAFNSYTSKNVKGEEILLHAGNLFNHQNPKSFWPILRNEIDNGRNLKIVFVGTVGPEIKQSIEKAGLVNRTQYKGFLPYKEMIEELSHASYLLVCPTEKRHVPGKLFEYLRSGKPILAFGDNNEEVQRILFETKSGMLFPTSSGGKEFFDHIDNLRTNLDLVRQYDRKVIAEKLACLLTEAIK
jgi:glycosyltransferase involved in cell wall biosynthesis